MGCRTQLALAYLGAALLGCGATGPAPSDNTRPAPSAHTLEPVEPVSSDGLCTAWCDRLLTCRGGKSCACQAEGRDLSSLTRGYIARLTLCFDGVPCSSLDKGTAWSACHKTVLRMRPITRELRKFCFSSARRAAECGRRDEADQSACIGSFRHIADHGIAAAQACVDRPCGEVPGCVAQALAPH